MLSTGSLVLVSVDSSTKDHRIQETKQATGNSTSTAAEPGIKTSVDGEATIEDDSKDSISCGEPLEDEALVCDSCRVPQQEPLKAHYRPSWWGITVALFIVASSFIMFKGILFSLAYVFGVSLIVLASLPASVSPAKIRCENCGELYKEKLGQCPHCGPPLKGHHTPSKLNGSNSLARTTRS